jgi:hypothetical protein
MSVLDMTALYPSEIDFLVSQALQIAPGDFEHLMQMKIKLVEVAILSRMLKRDNLTFDEVAKTSDQLAKAQVEIGQAFQQMTAYEHTDSNEKTDPEEV